MTWRGITLGLWLAWTSAGWADEARDAPPAPRQMTLDDEIVVEAKPPAPRVVFVDGGIEQARRKMQALLAETRAGAMYAHDVSRPEAGGRPVGVVVARWPKHAPGKLMHEVITAWTAEAQVCERHARAQGETVRLVGRTHRGHVVLRPAGAASQTALGKCLRERGPVLDDKRLRGPLLLELTFAGR